MEWYQEGKGPGTSLQVEHSIKEEATTEKARLLVINFLAFLGMATSSIKDREAQTERVMGQVKSKQLVPTLAVGWSHAS